MQLDAFGPTDFRTMVTRNKILLIEKQESGEKEDNDELEQALSKIPSIEAKPDGLKKSKSLLKKLKPSRRKKRDVKSFR